jgi:serine/threonine-protein kinase
MIYCVNPECKRPKNPRNASVCQNCGSKLLLHNRYHVLGVLGKGGFGATFAAANLSLSEPAICVIKQLRPATNDADVWELAKNLFEREVETLGSLLNHPQVPKLLDYFEENQQFYLVQEYIKGHNLYQEVKRHGPFSEASIQQFLSEILPILQYVHSRRIVHRDIKPANLIRRSDDRKLVLIDFGAVKNRVSSVVAGGADSTSAFTAFAVGTAGFAPPEQLAMRPVYASDIYALGVTCLYLLTGRSPKHLGCDPGTGELFWEKYVTVSEKLAKILKTMLAVSLRDRYQSAEAVLEALEMLPYEESMKQSLLAPLQTSLLPSSSGGKLPSSGWQDSGELHSQISTTPYPPSSPRKRLNSGVSTFGVPVTNKSVQPLLQNQPLRQPNTRSQKRAELTNRASLKLDAQAFLEAYKKGKRDFAQQDLTGFKLREVCLSGINLYQARLTHINLSRADLSNSNLGRIDLRQAILRKANLIGAYLVYANLEGADLRGADLSGANLKHANLKGANLCNASLLDAQVAPEQLASANTNWFTIMPSGKRGFW